MSSRTNKHYSEALKLEVVKRYLNGERATVLMREYGISDAKRVRIWTKKYQNGESFAETRGKASLANGVRKGRTPIKHLSLEEQIKHLTMENNILKKSLGYQVTED